MCCDVSVFVTQLVDLLLSLFSLARTEPTRLLKFMLCGIFNSAVLRCIADVKEWTDAAFSVRFAVRLVAGWAINLVESVLGGFGFLKKEIVSNSNNSTVKPKFQIFHHPQCATA